ncbi:importin 13 [Tieghemostelium lacteum]|uniref:Importin 13 n=1 Tax=Tieghemostelium lacteum TaxID=361077 RepID=A0A151ZJ12_TIELA|nr:importin 13 [Tieghemostelium lacteum]|eukprot:KYQ93895.1 importin 13 [Tieghemostelium lacteum]
MNLDNQVYNSSNNDKQEINESQFSIDSVQNILRSFYFPSHGDYSQIVTNQEWLVLFQESLSAWEIAPILLHSNIKEIQYFGASTIETKVKSSWLSLSDQSKSSLLEKLLVYLRNCTILNGNIPQHVNGNLSPTTPSSPTPTHNGHHQTSPATSPNLKLNNNNNNDNSSHNSSNGNGNTITTSNIVITRLCLAVSVIACHSTLDLWKNPIKDIISFAFPDIENLDVFCPNQLNLILELLTILPEELLNSDYITQEKRNKIGIEFFKYGSKIIQLLSKVMTLPISPQTITYMKLSFKCFKSWVLFDIPPKEYLVDNQLIHHCFEQVSKNPILVEEFIILLDEIFSFMGGKIFKQFPLSFHPIVNRITEIFSRFYVLALGEQNEMICHSIYFLFCHIADNHTKLLLNSPSADRLFQAILEMSKTIDLESCDLLSPIISNIHNLAENKVDVSKWNGLLLEFIEVLRFKCQYPSSGATLSKEDQERFNNFRVIACDSLLEIFTTIEKSTLEHLLNKLLYDITAYPKSTWQSIESTIYLLGCLSEGLTDDASFIPHLFLLLSKLPIQSTPLIKSTIVLAGKYASLLDKSNQFLEKIISDFIPAFSNPELKSVASESFLSITKNERCSILLSSNIQTLIHLCTPYLYKNDTNHIYEESNIKILESLLNIISVMTRNDILNYTLPLVKPYIHIVEEFSKLTRNYQANDKRLFMAVMKIITKFCKILETPEETVSTGSPPSSQQPTDQNTHEVHPLIPIIQHLLPIFAQLITNSNLTIDAEILECLGQLYKRSLLSCGTRDAPLIAPEINSQLTKIFLSKPVAPLLNTLSIMVSVLPHDQYTEHLQQSVSLLTPVVIDIWKKNANVHLLKSHRSAFIHQDLKQPMNYNISIYPDISKEYFGLIQQFFKYNILSLPLWILKPLFQIPLENILNIHDKTTARCCFQFLSSLIQKSVEKKEVPHWKPALVEIEQLLQQHIDYLIKQLLMSIGGGSERSILPLVAEVFSSLITFYPTAFRNIALSQFSIEGFPSSKITFQQKEKFLNIIMRNKSREQIRAIEDFYLISTGISNNKVFT